MPAEPLMILAAYSVAIVAASMFGGWLPNLVRMTHTRTQVAMSFVAGLMLGVALYHLVPHALAQLGDNGSIDLVMYWVMGGLILMLVMQRLFHFHQHDFSTEQEGLHETSHHHSHGQNQSQAHNQGSLSWVGIALGLGVHTLVDGIALGATIKGEWLSGATGWIGLGVFLAIFLHKPLGALSITTMMKTSGMGSGARTSVNVAFAMLCPLGALLFVWGVTQLGPNRDLVIGCALAFSAGVFLCISLSDLLPEVHFHSHDKAMLTLSFLLGIALAFAIGFMEPHAAHSMEMHH